MSDDPLPEADRAESVPHPRMAERLIGQHDAEAQILDAIGSGRLHHAWLITGPEGVGKATLAWRMARYLLATPVDDGGGLFGDAPAIPETLDVAPDHPVARRVAALSEPRLFLLRRAWDADRKRLKAQITVDDVRSLKSFFTMSAAEGGRRIAIVDAADDMNISAANALLKILEEPPKDAILILISHRPSRLLPTIRSRCRLVRLPSLSPQDLGKVMQSLELQTTAPGALAALSDGSAGDAVRLLHNDGLALYTSILDIFQSAPGTPRGKILALADAVTARGAEEKRDLFFRLFDLALSRLARTGAGAPPALPVTEAELACLTRLAPNAAAARRWAALQQQIAQRTQHAVAVNLDLQVLILEHFGRIDAAARDTVALANA